VYRALRNGLDRRPVIPRFLRWIKTMTGDQCQSAHSNVQEPVMNTAEWSDALALAYEPLDALHQEFVVRLAAAQTGSDLALPQRWADVIQHTELQFARENQWMQQTRYPSADNHVLQHRVVLKLMHEGLALAQAGQVAAVREMAHELAAWFPKHTQSQDAALAMHLRRVH
jgi:hemerythrin-like metal-binding protein